MFLVGCADELPKQYGRRKGPDTWNSVNGTGVLAEMFEKAGHEVFSWWRLSPRLGERADCIVWFPNDFQPPPDEVRGWLEDWLTAKPDRTLIYVGRDFDAAPGYWDEIAVDATVGQKTEIVRRKINDQSDFRGQLGGLKKSTDCDWFRLKKKYRPRQVTTLDGEPDWTREIDAKKIDIKLNLRMRPAPDAQVVLESEGDMLVSIEQWPADAWWEDEEWVEQGTLETSQLIVVANGSFLLNLPLVNHEHRKLAGQLIHEIGPPEQSVVFLESGHGGPPISDDAFNGPPTGLEIFHVWPTNWILMHLSILGIIFCFARFPIFGRPRDPDPAGTSNFGKHIRAMAELLARSRDATYAQTRLLHYHQTVRSESEKTLRR